MKLLIATTNSGKLNEITAFLKGYPFEIFSLNDFGLNFEVEENGGTYDENAVIKAEAYCRASGIVTLADDTGLEVDQLDGRPGIFSARYVDKPDASDADRRAKLLQELAEFPHPWTGHFHCSVAVAAPNRDSQVFDGNVYGELITEERGKFGFGYDCLMVINGSRKTLAEMLVDEKNKFSHRAKAVQKAIPYLLSLQE